MNYTSAVFLLMGLPLVIVTAGLVGRYTRGNEQHTRRIILLLSVVFLGWASWISLIVLAGLWVVNYLIGKAICWGSRTARWWLAAGVVVNIASLGIIKYSGWSVMGVPLGISFAVLFGISYLVEVYRGTKRQDTSLLAVGHYGLFFPKLVSGPVAEYADFSRQNSQVSFSEVARGLRRFILGLAKKLLLADVLAKGVAQIFAMNLHQLNPTYVWVGGFLFSMQIWLDFSGYTDMAIGLAQILGYRLPENFNFPYMATSVRDFWRRWHMSFMGWLRRYVYIPLGGNRRGRWRWVRNVLLVFLISGIWHGVGWNFVVWGVYFGVVVVLERWTGFPDKYGRQWLGRVYTWGIVLVGWLIFRANTLKQAQVMIGLLLRISQVSLPQAWELVNAKMMVVIIFGILLTTPAAVASGAWVSKRLGQPLITLLWLGLYGLCLMHMAANTYEPFLYAQF